MTYLGNASLRSWIPQCLYQVVDSLAQEVADGKGLNQLKPQREITADLCLLWGGGGGGIKRKAEVITSNVKIVQLCPCLTLSLSLSLSVRPFACVCVCASVPKVGKPVLSTPGRAAGVGLARMIRDSGASQGMWIT